jgi:hypothetical protein
MRSILTALLATVALAHHANAVDLVNRDEVARKVYVCGDGCDVIKRLGKFLDIAPGETKEEFATFSAFSSSPPVTTLA